MAEPDYLEGALQQLRQERAELDAAISALEKRVGKNGATSVPSGAASVPLSTLAGDAPVYRGEFFNLSVTRAAEKLLKRMGRPLKTPEIQAAFEKAGYAIKSKQVRPTIYTSLTRSRDFVKVLPDTWDLSERHPEAAQKKHQELETAKASKAKKTRRAAKAESKPGAEGLKVA